MKTRISFIPLVLISLALASEPSLAATRKSKAAPAAQRRAPPKPLAKTKDQQLQRALQYARQQNYQEGTRLLYQLSLSPQYRDREAQLYYILGQMLAEMGLDQVSANFFYKVLVKEGKHNAGNKYVKQSLQKLAIAADKLESDVLLKYSVKQVEEDQFPQTSHDMLYFRQGELKQDEKQFMDAARLFARVRKGSLFYQRAQYQLGLALAESGDLQRAQSVFHRLANDAVAGGKTDRNRVNAMLGRARVFYQAQSWEEALKAYRAVPRDTEQWHEALFESSWAMLRAGQFRSALSNFHSLHSVYYDDFYQPESLYLRGLVYLYICKYEDLDITLKIYERIYDPVYNVMKGYINRSPTQFYQEVAKVANNFEAMKGNKAARGGLGLPFFVVRSILKEGNVKRSFSYLNRLQDELKRIDSLPPVWRTSGIGRASRTAVMNRIKRTRDDIGEQAKAHVQKLFAELEDIRQQIGFLKIEMISGQRTAEAKQIVGKGFEKKIDEDTDRNFYIQNGFDYWPFDGEYWLDEIGNYQYVGVSACE